MKFDEEYYKKKCRGIGFYEYTLSSRLRDELNQKVLEEIVHDAFQAGAEAMKIECEKSFNKIAKENYKDWEDGACYMHEILDDLESAIQSATVEFPEVKDEKI